MLSVSYVTQKQCLGSTVLFVFRFTIHQNKMLTLGDYFPKMGCVPQVLCQPMGTALNNLNFSKEFNISFTLSDYYF